MTYRWTSVHLWLEAKKYATRAEFRKGSNGAYQSALKQGHLDKICGHMKPSKRGRPRKQP